MKPAVLLLFSLFFASLLSCGSKEHTKPTGTIPEQTSFVDGKTIYVRECVLCHGEKGDKGVAGSANLTQSSLLHDERVYIITNGRGVMQPFKNKLTPNEIEAVARFTQELRQ